MRSPFVILIVALAAPFLVYSQLPAQEGPAQQLGRRIDQGLEQLSQEVQEAWTEVRARVDRLGVQGRVYGRLRWDKAFADEPIDVSVETKDIVTLTGRVQSEAARQQAIELARNTVGVREVIDRLRVEPGEKIAPSSAK
jgi:osmotically-inducible protein OsmY